MIKKTFAALLLIVISALPAFSKTADSKTFYVSADNMFMTAISTLTKLNYKIIEMQTDSGYILFRAQNDLDYLMIVTKTGTTNSNVKILKTKKGAPVAEIQKKIYDALTLDVTNLPNEVK